MSQEILSILGCGNLGISIAKGLVQSGRYKSSQIILTKRKTESSHVKELIASGFNVSANNIDAVKRSKIVIIAVTPAQLDDLLDSIKNYIDSQIIISCVSGASIDDIKDRLGSHQNTESVIVRAMPNTAIQYCQSMTCLAVRSIHSKPASFSSIEEKKKDYALDVAKEIFDQLGKTFILPEEQIVPATALCACGIAFFCRAIRAASQGGCEIGFHAEDAIMIAAQTAKGAATLLLENKNHPEFEIDKVTTPQGCTISGLNTMEHCGFSSSIIKGITTSAEKAANLYNSKKEQKQQQQQHQQSQPQNFNSPNKSQEFEYVKESNSVNSSVSSNNSNNEQQNNNNKRQNNRNQNNNNNNNRNKRNERQQNNTTTPQNDKVENLVNEINDNLSVNGEQPVDEAANQSETNNDNQEGNKFRHQPNRNRGGRHGGGGRNKNNFPKKNDQYIPSQQTPTSPSTTTTTTTSPTTANS